MRKISLPRSRGGGQGGGLNLRRPLGWLAACLIAAGAALVVSSMAGSPQARRPATVLILPASTAVDGAGPNLPDPRRTSSFQNAGLGVVATLSIPRIGITDAPIRDRGPDGKGGMLVARGYTVTHFAPSAVLGAGNAVLYGHDDIEGSVFANLAQLQPGDLIAITIGGIERDYRVSNRKVVLPTAVEILNPTPDARLTLFTCWPTNIDNRRLVVTALLARTIPRDLSSVSIKSAY